jgi:hypothetical protein
MPEYTPSLWQFTTRLAGSAWFGGDSYRPLGVTLRQAGAAGPPL